MEAVQVCTQYHNYVLTTDSVFDVMGLDINECEEVSSGCDGTCINTIGSYDCLCSGGRVWSANNHTCEGMLSI